MTTPNPLPPDLHRRILAIEERSALIAAGERPRWTAAEHAALVTLHGDLVERASGWRERDK